MCDTGVKDLFFIMAVPTILHLYYLYNLGKYLQINIFTKVFQGGCTFLFIDY